MARTTKTTKAHQGAALGLANHLAKAFGGTAVPTKNGAAVVAKPPMAEVVAQMATAKAAAQDHAKGKPELDKALSEAVTKVATKAKAKPKAKAKAAPKAKPAKAGPNKTDKLVEMMRRPQGATLAEMAKATGWKDYSVRGVITNAVRGQRGLDVVLDKTDEKRGATVFRIKAKKGSK